MESLNEATQEDREGTEDAVVITRGEEAVGAIITNIPIEAMGIINIEEVGIIVDEVDIIVEMKVIMVDMDTIIITGGVAGINQGGTIIRKFNVKNSSQNKNNRDLVGDRFSVGCVSLFVCTNLCKINVEFVSSSAIIQD